MITMMRTMRVICVPYCGYEPCVFYLKLFESVVVVLFLSFLLVVSTIYVQADMDIRDTDLQPSYLGEYLKHSNYVKLHRRFPCFIDDYEIHSNTSSIPIPERFMWFNVLYYFKDFGIQIWMNELSYENITNWSANQIATIFNAKSYGRIARSDEFYECIIIKQWRIILYRL